MIELTHTYFMRLPKELLGMILPYYSCLCYEPQCAGWDEQPMPTGIYNWMDVMYTIGLDRYEWMSHETHVWMLTETLIK